MGGKSAYSTEDLGCDTLLLVKERYLIRSWAQPRQRLWTPKMTIYRIHHDDKYMVYEISTKEVLRKLGREYPFHIDRSPISYKHEWNTPLEITFADMDDEDNSQMPDLSENDGRLFFNQEAYNLFHKLLDKDGEFLPIYCNNDQGWIFNPTTVAENLDALNEKLIGYDQHGNLNHFEFLDDKLTSTEIFRAKIDEYYGIFCKEKFKNLYEKSEFIGIKFQTDLANFTGERHSLVQS